MPIYGRLADWQPLATAASHGPVWHGPSGPRDYVPMAASPMPALQATRRHVSQGDLYGNRGAREFLQRKFDEWATDPRRGTFRREVWQSEWNYINYFMNSCAADVTVHDGGVVMGGIALTLATHAWPEVPCFIGMTRNGTRFHLIPALNKPDYFRFEWENLGDD